ncbi:PPE domain-containing protein [Saccharopolyspora sp. NPDC000359]|uniref:PPE domain-containing protein n=1 Tax=Saccharopolyspora sp. NPDC000359 TaxID=3154251 RepID=UPI00332E0D21
MTSPPSGGNEYIADYEHQAYQQGKKEYSGVSDMPIFGDVMSQALSQAYAKKEAAQYGQQQARALSVDQELREKPGKLGNTHYLSFEHKEMDRFVKENFDPTEVHDVGRIYHGHGQDLLEVAEEYRRAVEKTEETWQGEAGDAMRAHVTQLAEHMSHSGNAAQLTGNQIGLQAEAGERAKNSMPEVIEFDMKQELKNYFSDPNPFTAISRANDIMEKQEKSQAAHAEAAQVMSTMEGDFGQAAAQTPAFVPAPRGPEEVGQPPETRQPIGSINPTTNISSTPNSTPSSTQSAWTTPTSPGSPSVPSPPGGSNPPSIFPSTTNPVWQQNPVGGGTDTRWNPQTGKWERRNPYNGNWAPLPPNQQRPAPGGGTGRPNGPGGGGSLARPGGGGGAGGGRLGGIGGGGVGGAGNQLGAGGRAGVGGLGAAGTAGVGGSGSAGGAGARGGAGMAGAGAAGRGHGGKSEEDNEHESKYVLDTDEAWEDLGLPKAAPPVFGE